MKQDRLQSATDAIRRNDHPNILTGVVAGVGVPLGICGMEWLSLAALSTGDHSVCDTERARRRIVGRGAGAAARPARWACHGDDGRGPHA